MNFEDVLLETRRIVEDLGIRWDDRAISRKLVKGVNEVKRKTGAVTERTTLNMVQSQTEYDLTSQGRLLSVGIIPENSIELKRITQVPVESLPVAANEESDPEMFSLNTSGGADGNQMTLILFPPPGRTQNGAIVIEQAEEWVFSSNVSATSVQLETVIPVLPKFEEIVIWMTAGFLLEEMNDSSFVQKGQYWLAKAEKDLGNLAYVNSLSYYGTPLSRSFP